jgi:hypothetical protein
MKYVLVAIVGGLAGVAMVAGLNRVGVGRQLLGS